MACRFNVEHRRCRPIHPLLPDARGNLHALQLQCGTDYCVEAVVWAMTCLEWLQCDTRFQIPDSRFKTPRRNIPDLLPSYTPSLPFSLPFSIPFSLHYLHTEPTNIWISIDTTREHHQITQQHPLFDRHQQQHPLFD